MKRAPVVGTYHLLHVYLRDRFANRVVLTFAEVEDLLGFHLPEAARVDRLWWQPAAPGVPSPQSDAWLLANRTASVSLAAQRVVFDRNAGGPDELQAFHGR
ncbi:MAG TPA: hypothetical protein VLV86_17375 [Vicinamibacterales bacterium]|nr:hypothetical protein [Vicinamibacterales bacterium]